MKRTGFNRRQPPPLKRITPIAKRSPKRKAYRASAARVEGVKHMMAVKSLPCICCGAPPPSAAHHCRSDGMARDDMKVLPLCWGCHQGPDGYHAIKATWEAQHGKDYSLLPRVDEMLERKDYE
jgi:hypothetical protein